MRCALAESVIANQLTTNIFQDFYIVGSISTKLHGLAEVLSTLDEQGPRKASIARYQIATALEDSQVRNQIILHTVEIVERSLLPWLPQNTDKKTSAQESLRHDLTELFKDAVDLWQRLRRAPEHCTASADLISDEWAPEDARQLYDTIKTDEKYRVQGAALETNLPVAVLFPQIWKGSQVIFHGHALFPSQSAFIMASLENTKASMSNGSVRRRRPSSSGTVHAPGPIIPEDKASNTSRHRAQGSAGDSSLPTSSAVVAPRLQSA